MHEPVLSVNCLCVFWIGAKNRGQGLMQKRSGGGVSNQNTQTCPFPQQYWLDAAIIIPFI